MFNRIPSCLKLFDVCEPLIIRIASKFVLHVKIYLVIVRVCNIHIQSPANELAMQFHAAGSEVGSLKRRFDIVGSASYERQEEPPEKQLENDLIDCTDRQLFNLTATPFLDVTATQFLDVTDEHFPTQLHDLNNDCLIEIFAKLDVIDLCSVSRTSIRFKENANQVFRQKYKVCKLTSLAKTLNEARRILVTFGTFIYHLSLESYFLQREAWSRLLELVSLSCGDTLKSLFLCGFQFDLSLTNKLRPLFNRLLKLHIAFCFIDESAEKFFADCESMTELKVSYGNDRFEDFVFNTSFPQLERLQCKGFRGCWKDFLWRHPDLKSLSVLNMKASSLRFVAHFFRQLEEFEVNHLDESKYLEKGLNSLLTLQSIRKLQINSRVGNLTKFTQQLKTFESLQYLELKFPDIDNDFISAVTQLHGLQVLHLHLTEVLNLNQLHDLNQLTELSINSTEIVDLDVTLLIERLSNLKTLNLNVKYKMDMDTYSKIVVVVQQRPDRTSQTLQITCRRAYDLHDVGYRNIVKIIPLKKKAMK